MPDSRPTVAIVVPVFNEEPVLPELFARLEAVFGGPADWAWRAVFVDDGSRDRSAELVRAQGARELTAALVVMRFRSAATLISVAAAIGALVLYWRAQPRRPCKAAPARS